MPQLGAAWKLATRSPALLILGWFLFIGLCLAFWWSTRHSLYSEEREAALDSTRQMAQQMASTAAGQSSAMLRLLDYTTRSLGEAWSEGGAPGLASAIRRINAVLPGDGWLSVRIISPEGHVIYELERVPLITMQSVPASLLLDLHQLDAEPALHIGSPLRYPAEDRWALPLSFPISGRNNAKGVIEMLVSTDYLSQALRQAFPSSQDLALILDWHGHTLAHSLEAAPLALAATGLTLPFQLRGSGVTPNFLSLNGATPRIYAWQRLDDAPLYAVVGVGRQYTAEPVDAAILANQRANIMGTLALLAAAICLAALFWQRQRAWVEQQTHNERLDLALRGADLGWWDLDFQTKSLHFNSQWALTLGFQPGDLPDSAERYQRWLHPEDQSLMRRAFVNHLRGHSPRFQAEYRVRHRRGHWIWVLDRGQVLLRDNHGRAVRAAGTLLDISARKRAEAMLTAEARTDPLTGLANRRALLDRLEHQALYTSPTGQADILMLLDIDHFKLVNDSLGHAAGDRALQHLAHLLRTNLRVPDFAARLGGEEFAILAPGVGTAGGMRLAERLRQRIAENPVPTLPDVQLTVSIGVAVFDPQAIEDSMHAADQAMYQAKHAGRDQIRLWHPPTSVHA